MQMVQAAYFAMLACLFLGTLAWLLVDISRLWMRMDTADRLSVTLASILLFAGFIYSAVIAWQILVTSP